MTNVVSKMGYTSRMYAPRQIGTPNHARGRVVYHESAPPAQLADTVYCTWELYTVMPLTAPFDYLVLPDACADIIFDLSAASTEPVFIMVSDTNAVQVDLGTSFHYVGVRFLPGVLPNTPHIEQLLADATTVRRQLTADQSDSTAIHDTLVRCAVRMRNAGLAQPNHLMHQVLAHAANVHKVADIESLTGYNRRQLQRIFMKQTGFTPRDFLKILRFQNTLASEPQHYYADQSHYIKEFKRITGMTPRIFRATY